MVRIKTTNVVKDEETTKSVRTVQCPICNTFLNGVDKSVVVMTCWLCNKEFKIQQDSNKYESSVEPKRFQRTISKREEL